MILWTFTLIQTHGYASRDERKGTIMIRCLAGAIFIFAAAALFGMLF